MPLQFTLCYVLKGNKPDFHNAMMGDVSKPMYEQFLTQLGEQYKPEAVKGELRIFNPCYYGNGNTGGLFGAHMNVVIENDGPVTIPLDTPTLPPAKEVFFGNIFEI